MTLATEAQAEAFSGRMVDILNNSMLGLMISIGHRTGLFDAMAGRRPLTSDELADTRRAQRALCPRMAGRDGDRRIVELRRADPAVSPAARARGLADARGGPRQLRVAGCSSSPCWAPSRPRSSTASATAAACPIRSTTTSSGSWPRTARTRSTRRCSTSPCPGARARRSPAVRDRRGRHRLRQRPRPQPHGRGVPGQPLRRLRLLGRRRSRRARARRPRRSLSNAHFDATVTPQTLAITEGFDFITTFDSIHDQARPDVVLAGIRRRSARTASTCGRYRGLERPRGQPRPPARAVAYTVSTMHCMTVSLALGGMGLGTVWGEQLALRMLADAGFAHVDVARSRATSSTTTTSPTRCRASASTTCRAGPASRLHVVLAASRWRICPLPVSRRRGGPFPHDTGRY